MYAIIRDRATLKDSVKLFTFYRTAVDYFDECCAGDSTATLVELTELAENKLLSALRDEEELQLTLQTGLSRKVRGVK